MWSEKQKNHLLIKCQVCERELEAEFSDPEERVIEVKLCEYCLEQSDQATYDAGFDDGFREGIDDDKHPR